MGGASNDKVEALFEAVYASPDDDAPRHELAEVLTQGGDPRGEFIALQLARARGARTPKDALRREKALLEAHLEEWLLPLDQTLVKRTVRFERGFPVSGDLNFGKTAAELERPIGCRALATLRKLTLERGSIVYPIEYYQRLLQHTPLRGLRVISGLRRALLSDLLSDPQPWALERVECPSEGGGGLSGKAMEQQELARLHERFAQGGGLPHLADLSLSFVHAGGDPEAYAWLWKTETGRRLQILRMNVGSYALDRWQARLSSCGETIALQKLVLFTRYEYVLHRTPSGGWTRITGRIRERNLQHLEYERKSVADLLGKLAGRVEEVEIEGL